MPYSSNDFLECVREKLSSRGKITFKKLFGEIGVYADGKIIAIASENELYIKENDFEVKGEYFPYMQGDERKYLKYRKVDLDEI
jgi:TfoX/Sxy family transcriptional regulator of competence genes